MSKFTRNFIATIGFSLFGLISYIELAHPTHAYAQTNTFSTTTLGAAISNVNQTTVTLASLSNVVFPTQGANGSFLYFDKELVMVSASFAPPGTTTTTVLVVRGVGGTQAATHASGQLVFIGQGDWYSNAQTDIQPNGTCTLANVYAYPRIHVLTGSWFTCDSLGLWGYAGPGVGHPAQRNAITQVSATYTAKYWDSTIEATANSFTITLPAAAALPGKVYVLSTTSSGTITVTTAHGCATYTTAGCTVYSNGTVWQTF